MHHDLTPEQSDAYEILKGDDNVFLTGPAGTGKSFVVKQFLKSVDRKTFPVLASTGAAAVLVGGRTFHSFFGIGILEGGPDATIERAMKDRRLIRRLKSIDGFILDEVSMLSAEVLEVAEEIAKRARDNAIFPWGGLRVIAVGDFAQLPPVETVSQMKPWAFMGNVWRRSRFRPAMLSISQRSSNENFLRVLEKVRVGIVDEDVRDFLDTRIQELPNEMESNVTRLFPRRNQTQKFNAMKLDQLEEELVEIKSEYYGSSRHIERLIKQAPIPDILQIKQGCLVMLRQNDPKMRWVNGSSGIIEEIHSDVLLIRLLHNNRLVEVGKVTFSMQDAEGKVVASITNFPINLAYAATIHKAQGMTLDRVQVDIRNLWEPGQAYVALSRVTDPEGLYLTGWDEHSIKADQLVERYYDYLETQI